MTSILYLFSSISLSRSPLEQLEAEKEEREQKLKKMEQEMEQVFEMKVKEKKKKLKDSEAEVSGIVEQRSEVVQLRFTTSDEVSKILALSALSIRWAVNTLSCHVPINLEFFFFYN